MASKEVDIAYLATKYKQTSVEELANFLRQNPGKAVDLEVLLKKGFSLTSTAAQEGLVVVLTKENARYDGFKEPVTLQFYFLVHTQDKKVTSVGKDNRVIADSKETWVSQKNLLELVSSIPYLDSQSETKKSVEESTAEIIKSTLKSQKEEDETETDAPDAIDTGKAGNKHHAKKQKIVKLYHPDLAKHFVEDSGRLNAVVCELIEKGAHPKIRKSGKKAELESLLGKDYKLLSENGRLAVISAEAIHTEMVLRKSKKKGTADLQLILDSDKEFSGFLRNFPVQTYNSSNDGPRVYKLLKEYVDGKDKKLLKHIMSARTAEPLTTYMSALCRYLYADFDMSDDAKKNKALLHWVKLTNCVEHVTCDPWISKNLIDREFKPMLKQVMATGEDTDYYSEITSPSTALFVEYAKHVLKNPKEQNVRRFELYGLWCIGKLDMHEADVMRTHHHVLQKIIELYPTLDKLMTTAFDRLQKKHGPATAKIETSYDYSVLRKSLISALEPKEKSALPFTFYDKDPEGTNLSYSVTSKILSRYILINLDKFGGWKK